MTAPTLAAQRFFLACLIGSGLGAVYDFLRPLRPRFTALSDLVFCAAAGWGWLYLGFAICRGDLRLPYVLGLFLGGFLWERTAGRLFCPVFSGFWKLLGLIFRYVTAPLKKISHFVKILFASVKKWVTIKWSNRRHSRRKFGGKPNGRTKRYFQPHQDHLSAQQESDQGHADHRTRIVYGFPDHPAAVYERSE